MPLSSYETRSKIFKGRGLFYLMTDATQVVVCDYAGIESGNYDKESCILRTKLINVSVGKRALTDGKEGFTKAVPVVLYHIFQD